jgi:hypothetical protein
MKRFHILKPPAGKAGEMIDPDNPPWTEAMLGPPRFRGSRKPLAALLETLRLDPEVREYFRAKAKAARTETRINHAPRKAAKKKLPSRVARHR